MGMLAPPAAGYVVLLGGARSGKSDLAQRLAATAVTRNGGATVTVLATAEAFDDDLRARVARHRHDRPAGWQTIEEPRDLVSALDRVPAAGVVLLDCITVWAATLVHDGLDDAAVGARVRALAARLAARTAPTIVVSNEVGMGIHPETELGRRYRDLLGRSNRTLVERSAASYLVVAGRALELLAAEGP